MTDDVGGWPGAAAADHRHAAGRERAADGHGKPEGSLPPGDPQMPRPEGGDDRGEGAAARPASDPDAEPLDPVAEALRGLRDSDDAASRAETARMGAILEDAWSRLDRDRGRANVHIETLTMFGDEVRIGGGFAVGGGRSGERSAARDIIPLDEATLGAHLDFYVRPPRYPEALRLLCDHHLLVLAAPAGTGREAAAVNLLTEALDAEGGDGRCYRLTDPATVAIGDWAAPAPGSGYIADIDGSAKGRDLLVAAGVDEEWIDTMARRVRAAGSFLVVLTGAPRGALLEAAAHSHHVMTSLGEVAPVDIIARRALGAAPERAALNELRRSLAAAGALDLMARQPGPRAAVRLAAALAGDGDLAAAVQNLSDPTTQVHAWFGRHRVPEAMCFTLAAAALEGASYLTVSDAAVELYRLLEPVAADPPDLRFHEGLGTDHSWIELSSGAAGAESGVAGPGVGPRAPSHVRFTDDLLQPAVLRYAWLELDGCRSALLRWLRRLIDHRDIEVRARAAVTAALLARSDLDHALHRFLRGWAGDASRAAQEAAAAALGLVANEPELTEHVWRMLETWAAEEGSAFQNRLRRTAARAVGGPLGARQPERALDLLGRVLDDEEWRGLVAVSLSVLRLVELGRDTEVLGALLEWSRPQDDSAVVAQALSVFMFVVMSPVPWTRAPGGQSERPLLVADGGRHRRQMEELWARALARKPAQEHALEALRDYLTGHADKDSDALEAIRALLVGVAARGGRHRQRLDWYLGEWAADPDQPSRSAAVLRRALVIAR